MGLGASAADGDDPIRIVTEDFDKIRFAANGQAFTIAYAPEGTEIPAPPTAGDVASVSEDLGVPAGQHPGFGRAAQRHHAGRQRARREHPGRDGARRRLDEHHDRTRSGHRRLDAHRRRHDHDRSRRRVKAVILVGGFGTRLRPLTLTTPKNLLPVVHTPMVERVVAHLAQHGVTEAVLSLGYKPDTFLEAYPDGDCAGVALTYAVEDEPLDTAGAIRFAAGEAGIDERFVVVNGDVLTDLDVTRLVRFHDASGAEGTIALHTVEDPSRYGVVVTDVAGQVEAFVEKPSRDDAPSLRINAGTYVFEPSVLGRIPVGRPVSVERETFPAMVESSSLYALDGDAYWIDAGTPETYLQANLDLLAADDIAVHPEASVSDSAHIERSVIGAGAVIGDEATLTEALVLAGATIEPGARVHRSIVGPGAVIRAGAELLDLTVIGDHVDIEPDARLTSERIPQDVE